MNLSITDSSLEITRAQSHVAPVQLLNLELGDIMELVKNLFFPLLLVSVIFISGPKSSEGARVFTIVNYCGQTIWPAVFPGENFNGGGFTLKTGESRIFTAPVSWSGRIWGRTGCKFDSSGNGSCETGSCGTSFKCGASGNTPASLAEFTLASPDFYDVSLVDGFNLPITVTPINGSGGNCSAAGCDGDLRPSCPKELAVRGGGGRVVGCRSACDVFSTDEYCCKGLYANPVTCQPTSYSKIFKKACPTAYSYAYDDPSSIFTCSASDYVVSFCSSRNHSACSYHNDKLVCAAASGLRVNGIKWMMMAFTLIITTLWKTC